MYDVGSSMANYWSRSFWFCQTYKFVRVPPGINKSHQASTRQWSHQSCLRCCFHAAKWHIANNQQDASIMSFKIATPQQHYDIVADATTSKYRNQCKFCSLSRASCFLHHALKRLSLLTWARFERGNDPTRWVFWNAINKTLKAPLSSMLRCQKTDNRNWMISSSLVRLCSLLLQQHVFYH